MICDMAYDVSLCLTQGSRARLPFIIQMLIANHTFTVPGVDFTLYLQRRPQYYLLNIIIPSVVLAVLSALTFAVPVDSGEKLSLGISILLAFSVFMLILQDNTPQADTPVLGKYLIAQGEGVGNLEGIV